jgi:hypothetical protein
LVDVGQLPVETMLSRLVGEQSMSILNAENIPSRERVPESPPLQPGQHPKESSGDTARRAEMRQFNAFAAPRSTPTAFELSEELHRQSYEWTTAVRLLEQSEHALNCAEMDRHHANEELTRIIPNVLESSKQLSAAIDASRPGHPMPNLKELFVANAKSLEQLEGVATMLSNHFLRYRTAWEQYARSVADAQRLRAEAHRGSNARG